MQIDHTTTGVGALAHIEEVHLDAYPRIQALNKRVFGEERVIYRLDRRDLIFLLAEVDGQEVGYKVGYGESPTSFYSAKGGVLASHRRIGIARLLLYAMMDAARGRGYRRFAYDTFPNKHAGMTILGLNEGFAVTSAGYNAAYRDYRIRLEKEL